MSLQQFLADNRPELIKRTRARIATHSSPRPNEAEMEHGVPLFLSELLAQFVTALRSEEARDPAQKRAPSLPSEASIARSGALHGQNPPLGALRAGRVGSGSDTAAVVEKCLIEMRSVLADPKRPND